MNSSNVPVIDLSAFCKTGDKAAQEKVALQVRHACEQVGFFYITGHGCPSKVVNEMQKSTKDFFDQPLTAKLELEAASNPLWRGYNSLEKGAHSCTPDAQGKDRKESFTVGTEGTGSPMHGPNQWPDLVEGFETATRCYWDAISHTVAPRLMQALALSLELPLDFFTSKCHRNNHSQMVLLRYPPAGGGAEGCGAHTDCGFLTILTQDEEGLEVRHADKSWVSAPPIADAFVVNLGDMMAHWTNDRYQSTEHRVYNPSSTKTRHSIPFFFTVDYDTVVETIDSCRTNAQGYEPVQSGEYILKKLGLMYLAKQDEGNDETADSLVATTCNANPKRTQSLEPADRRVCSN